MIEPNAFTKLMPGLDFMRNMLQGAGQSLPTMGQWVAPTLDPAEIEKRINDLKAVHFWLEQNARMLGVTQALEVQRMTLSTLQTMNLPMAALREAMTLPKAATKPPPAAEPVAAPAPKAAPPQPAPAVEEAAAPAETREAGAKPAIDPMLWWGALTKQFADLATKAVQDGSAGLAKNLAAAREAARAARQPAAKKTGKTAAPAAKGAATKVAKTAARRSTARKRG